MLRSDALSGVGVKIPDYVRRSVQRSPLVWALPLQAFLLFSNLDLLDPWYDEWFTITAVSKPVGQVVSGVAANIHPPLYFVLLHYWTQLPWTLSPVAQIRVMSAVWALAATVIIYFAWLRRERSRLQQMFLALWVLSPCLLLHARMARSYSMVLALASLAIYAAPRWAEQPGSGSSRMLVPTPHCSIHTTLLGWVSRAQYAQHFSSKNASN